MSTILAEQPLLVSVMLGVTVAGLVFGWLQTGRRVVGVAAVLIATLIPASWLLADAWVTDAERIRALVTQVADDVANNRHEAVLRVIGDAKTRGQAANELPRYEFTAARVSSFQYVRVEDSKSPREAEVSLVAQVTASEKRGVLKNIRVPRRLVLQLQETAPQQWVVIGYQHGPLSGGPDGYSSRPLNER